MSKESERVHAMKKNFMALHNQGYTIPEIAVKYNLSEPSVYGHLQEIALENSVTRESLLQRVITPRCTERIKAESLKVKVDIQQMQENFRVAIDATKKLIKQIDKILEESKNENYDC